MSDQIIASEDHVRSRTLVTVSMKEAAMWAVQPINLLNGEDDKRFSPLVDKNGSGQLDAYKKIETPSSIIKERDKAQEAGIKLHQTRLLAILKSQGIKPKTIDKLQLRAAAMSLSGSFGDEVTLTGLDPIIKTAMENHPNFDHDLMHLQDNTIDNPFRFLVDDNFIAESEFGKTDTGARFGKEGHLKALNDVVSSLSSSELEKEEAKPHKLHEASKDLREKRIQQQIKYEQYQAKLKLKRQREKQEKEFDKQEQELTLDYDSEHAQKMDERREALAKARQEKLTPSELSIGEIGEDEIEQIREQRSLRDFDR